MHEIEIFLKEFTEREDLKPNLESDINVTSSAYIHNLLKDEKEATCCSLLFNKGKKGFFLWSLNPSLHLPKGVPLNFNDILGKVNKHDDCDLCELINHVRLGSALKLSNIQLDELSLLKSKIDRNKLKKSCTKCQDTFRKYIEKYPNCLGFDGYIKCENNPIKSSESPEPYFNSTLLNHICKKLRENKIKLFGTYNAKENKSGNNYQYDIIFITEKNKTRYIYQVETKFGKNDKPNLNFVKRHILLKEFYKKSKVFDKGEVYSIFFRPYMNNNFIETIRKSFKQSGKEYIEQKQKIFDRSIENNEFIECSVDLPIKKEEKISFLKDNNNIITHINSLIDMISSVYPLN